jgi:hypothetical protein
MESRKLICNACFESQATLVLRKDCQITLLCEACYSSLSISDPSISQTPILLRIDYSSIEQLIQADQEFSASRPLLLSELISYKTKLHDFKTEMRDCVSYLKKDLNMKTSSALDELERIESNIEEVQAGIEIHDVVPTEIGLDLLRNFNELGLAGVLKVYKPEMMINHRAVIEAIERFIYVSDQPQTPRYAAEPDTPDNLEARVMRLERDLIERDLTIERMQEELNSRDRISEFEFVRSSHDSCDKSVEGIDRGLREKIEDLEAKLRKSKSKAKDYKASARDLHRLWQEKEQILQELRSKDEALKNQAYNIIRKDQEISALKESIRNMQAPSYSPSPMDGVNLSTLSRIESCISEEMSDSDKKELFEELHRNQSLISELRYENAQLKDQLDRKSQESPELLDYVRRIKELEEHLNNPPNRFSFSEEPSVPAPRQKYHEIADRIGTILITKLRESGADINSSSEEALFLQLSSELDHIKDSEIKSLYAEIETLRSQVANSDPSGLQFDSDSRKVIEDLQFKCKSLEQTVDKYRLENESLKLFKPVEENLIDPDTYHSTSQQLSVLTSINQSLNDDKHRLEQNAQNLHNEVMKLQQEKKTLEISLESMYKNIDSYEELEKLKQQNEILTQQAQRCIEDLNIIQEKKQFLEASLKQLSVNDEMLRQEIERLQHENCILRNNLNEETRKFDTLFREKEALEAEISSLKRENDRLRADFDNLKEERSLKIREDSHEDTIARLRKENGRAQDEDFIQDLDTSPNEMLELKGENERLNEESEKVLRDLLVIQMAKQDIEQDQGEVLKLRGENERLKEESERILRDLLVIQKAKQDLEASYNLLASEAAAKSSQSSDKDLLQEISDLKSKKEEMERDVEQMSKDIMIYNSRIAGLENTLQSEKTKTEKILAVYGPTIKELQNQISRLHTENNEIKEALNSSKASGDSSEAAFQLAQANEELKQKISQYEEQLSAQQASASSSDLKALQDQISDKDLELLNMSKENSDMRNQIEELKNMLVKKDSETEFLRTKLALAEGRSNNLPEERAQPGLEEELKKRISELQYIINNKVAQEETQNAKLSNIKATYNNIIQSQIEDIEFYKGQVSLLNTQAEASENLRKRLEESEKARQQAEIELAKYSQSSVPIVDTRNSELQNELEKHKHKSIALERDAQLLYRQKTELDYELNNYKTLYAQSKKESEDHRFQLDSLKMQQSALLASLKSERDQFFAQRDELSRLKIEANELKSQLEESNKVCIHLERQHKEDVKNLQIDLDKQNELVLQIGEQISLLESEKENLTMQLNSLLLKDRNNSLKQNSINIYQAEVLSLRNQLRDFHAVEKTSLISEESRQSHYSKYAGRRYIYLPVGKTIREIDVFLNTSIAYEVSAVASQPFECTSSCLIPNGDVFITGGANPASADTYIFVLRTGNLIQLERAPYAKFYVSTAFHADYIYALGGNDDKNLPTRTAARFSLMTSSWSVLPSMQNARTAASSIGAGDYILIFGGDEQNSIEYYHITTNSFNVLHLNIGSNFVVAGLWEDLIHLVGDSGIQVLDMEFKQRREEITRGSGVCYSINNLVRNEGKIYYVNGGKIEMVNCKMLTREVVEIN